MNININKIFVSRYSDDFIMIILIDNDHIYLSKKGKTLLLLNYLFRSLLELCQRDILIHKEKYLVLPVIIKVFTSFSQKGFTRVSFTKLITLLFSGLQIYNFRDEYLFLFSCLFFFIFIFSYPYFFPNHINRYLFLFSLHISKIVGLPRSGFTKARSVSSLQTFPLRPRTVSFSLYSCFYFQVE